VNNCRWVKWVGIILRKYKLSNIIVPVLSEEILFVVPERITCRAIICCSPLYCPMFLMLKDALNMPLFAGLNVTGTTKESLG